MMNLDLLQPSDRELWAKAERGIDVLMTPDVLKGLLTRLADARQALMLCADKLDSLGWHFEAQTARKAAMQKPVTTSTT